MSSGGFFLYRPRPATLPTAAPSRSGSSVADNLTSTTAPQHGVGSSTSEPPQTAAAQPQAVHDPVALLLRLREQQQLLQAAHQVMPSHAYPPASGAAGPTLATSDAHPSAIPPFAVAASLGVPVAHRSDRNPTASVSEFITPGASPRPVSAAPAVRSLGNQWLKRDAVTPSQSRLFLSSPPPPSLLAAATSGVRSEPHPAQTALPSSQAEASYHSAHFSDSAPEAPAVVLDGTDGGDELARRRLLALKQRQLLDMEQRVDRVERAARESDELRELWMARSATLEAQVAALQAEVGRLQVVRDHAVHLTAIDTAAPLGVEAAATDSQRNIGTSSTSQRPVVPSFDATSLGGAAVGADEATDVVTSMTNGDDQFSSERRVLLSIAADARDAQAVAEARAASAEVALAQLRHQLFSTVSAAGMPAATPPRQLGTGPPSRAIQSPLVSPPRRTATSESAPVHVLNTAVGFGHHRASMPMEFTVTPAAAAAQGVKVVSYLDAATRLERAVAGLTQAAESRAAAGRGAVYRDGSAQTVGDAEARSSLGCVSRGTQTVASLVLRRMGDNGRESITVLDYNFAPPAAAAPSVVAPLAHRQQLPQLPIAGVSLGAHVSQLAGPPDHSVGLVSLQVPAAAQTRADSVGPSNIEAARAEVRRLQELVRAYEEGQGNSNVAPPSKAPPATVHQLMLSARAAQRDLSQERAPGGDLVTASEAFGRSPEPLAAASIPHGQAARAAADGGAAVVVFQDRVRSFSATPDEAPRVPSLSRQSAASGAPSARSFGDYRNAATAMDLFAMDGQPRLTPVPPLLQPAHVPDSLVTESEVSLTPTATAPAATSEIKVT